MKVEVSNGELLDKLSILEIKFDKDLPVQKEMDILYKEARPLLDNECVLYCYNILTAINSQLWDIEDSKRQCERDKDFSDKFVSLARCVYMLNDERAKIKKYIDTLSKSDITEIKSHGGY